MDLDLPFQGFQFGIACDEFGFLFLGECSCEGVGQAHFVRRFECGRSSRGLKVISHPDNLYREFCDLLCYPLGHGFASGTFKRIVNLGPVDHAEKEWLSFVRRMLNEPLNLAGAWFVLVER